MYKSLEAYNQFVCGWVRDLGVMPVKDDVCVLVARVSMLSLNMKHYLPLLMDVLLTILFVLFPGYVFTMTL